MPAGDLIDADWQLELAGLLTGATTPFQFGPEGITGLGLASAKTQDVDLAGEHGTFANADFRNPRIINVHYELNDHIDDFVLTRALEDYVTLEAAWSPTIVNQQLHVQLPGFGHVYFVGRARGLELMLADLKSGVVQAIGEFHNVDGVRRNA